MNKIEARLEIYSILLFICFTFLIEAFFIHKTYQYFGGGALNRPFAIQSYGDYFLYAIISVLSDGVLYITLAICMVKLISAVFQRWNIAQKTASVMICLLVIFSIAFLIKAQLQTFFFDRFDLGVLKDLADGSFLNILPYISGEYVIVTILVIPLPLLIFFFLIRKLRGVTSQALSITDQWPWIFKSLPFFWILLIALHFAVMCNEPLKYGLMDRLSYRSMDFLLMKLTDFDHDGYSLLSSPQDTQNFDPNRHPYSVEIPGNGVDENDIAGDLSSIDNQIEKYPFESAPKELVKKNVIIAVIETFRTEVIDQEIDGKEVTPFLNTLKKNFSYTKEMFSNYGVTARAIQSIFMGTLSYTPKSTNLFSWLAERGYKTICISAQNETWGRTDEILNLNQFDFFYDSRQSIWDKKKLTPWERAHSSQLKIDSKKLKQKIFSALAKHRTDPFVMYLNYQDLHYPYYAEYMDTVFIQEGRNDPAFFTKDNVENIKRQYANAAHYFDSSIKELFDKLKSLKLMEKTIVIILGDHPDSFYENGILGHAWSLEPSQRQTPLFVVNGKGSYATPIGQDEVIKIIINSLNPKLKAPSTFTPSPSKKVFLLTSTLDKPRQVGWMANDRLFSYDFKTKNVEIKQGGHSRIVGTNEIKNNSDIKKTYRQLINRWESELYLKSHGGR